MSETLYRGIVSYVDYERHFATIEYVHNGSKKKSVNCKTDAAEEGKKPHYFRVGDEVAFQLKRSEKGDRMVAHAVKFLFNAGLERLIQKSRTENRFTGYLKEVDDALFVKEIESYLFFPLQLSPWENHPSEQMFNAPVTFQLINTEKQKGIAAVLAYRIFIPEYRQALEWMQAKKVVEAHVERVSPHAVYVSFCNGKLRSKIPLPMQGLQDIAAGATLPVHITYMNTERIVVMPVSDN